jgi:hypothetical protein
MLPDEGMPRGCRAAEQEALAADAGSSQRTAASGPRHRQSWAGGAVAGLEDGPLQLGSVPGARALLPRRSSLQFPPSGAEASSDGADGTLVRVGSGSIALAAAPAPDLAATPPARPPPRAAPPQPGTPTATATAAALSAARPGGAAPPLAAEHPMATTNRFSLQTGWLDAQLDAAREAPDLDPDPGLGVDLELELPSAWSDAASVASLPLG